MIRSTAAMPARLFAPVQRASTAALLVALTLLSGGAAHAQFSVSVIKYTSNWLTTYNAFPSQESFESASLISGLSITVDGNLYPSPETYTTLPHLYNPNVAAPVAGPFNANVWVGTFMVTNFGYDPSKAIGSRWLNNWAPQAFSSAKRITFNFAGGAAMVGMGLSNFQSTSPPSSDAFPSITNHRLVVNGTALSPDLEAMAGANWVSGGNVRNGYLVVTATGNTPINSLGIDNINIFAGQLYDGLNIDALGFTSFTTPTTRSSWGRVKALYR
jgi:hypothetical protein